MLARTRNLASRLETLERRHLLAGNVLVSLIDGDLRLEGDDLSNVVSLQSLTSPDGTPGGGAFLITPDATTSLNDLPAGTPLTIDRVTRVSVSMGGGDDHLTLHGHQGAFVQALHIETGDGADRVEVDSFEVRGLLSVTSTGADQLQLHSSSVGQRLEVHGQGGGALHLSSLRLGELDKSSPLLYESLSIENMDATLTGVVVQGSARISSSSPSSLHMQDCPVSGVLSVDQSGGSVVLQKVRAFDAHLTMSPPAGSSSSSLRLEDSTIDRVLTVGGNGQSGGGHAGATLDNVRVGRHIDKSSPLLYTALVVEDIDLTVRDSKVGGSAFISNASSGNSVSIDSSSVSGGLNVSTGKLEIKFSRAHSAFVEASSSSGGSPSVSIRDSEFDRSLTVLGAEGAPASTTLSSLRVRHGDFVVSKQIDKSSPSLSPALTLVNSSVTASLCEVGGSVVVSNRSSSSNVSIDSCETIGGLRVTTGGGRISVSQTRAAGMYLKIDGIKGEAVPFSSVVLDRCVADYALEVRGGGGTGSSTSLSNVQVAIDKSTPLLSSVCVVSDRRVTVSSSSVGASARLSSSGGGGVVLAGDLTVSGALTIDSSSGVSVSESRAADMYIKIGDIQGEAVPFSAVVLDRCIVDSTLRVEGGGGTGSFTSLSDVSVGGGTASVISPLVCDISDRDVTVLDSELHGSARLSSSGGSGGRVAVYRSSVTGSLSVDSSSSISVAESSAADMFLKIEGVSGEPASFSSVVLDRCDVERSLVVQGGGGDGSFTSLSSVHVGIDKSSPLLAEVCVVQDRHVVVSDSSVSSSARFSSSGGGGRVSLSSSSVAGSLSVVSSSSISLSQCSAADAFLKIEGIKGEAVSHSSVSLDRCDVGNALHVVGGTGTGSSTSLSSVRVGIDKSTPVLAETCVIEGRHVSVSDLSVVGSARLSGGGGSGGSVLLDSCVVSSSLSIDASSSVSVSQSSAAAIYIKIEGVEGEAVSHSSVVLDRCDVGHSLEVRGGGGLGSFTSLSSVRVGIDKSTPVLAETCVVADRVVTASDVTVVGSARLSGQGEGGGVSVVGASVSGGFTADGWNHLSVSQSRAADMFLKIDGIKGESSLHSSVVLDRCDIDNTLLVQGGGSSSSFTSLSSVRVGIDKSSPLLAEACVVHDRNVSVTDSSVHGSARFSGGGGSGGSVVVSGTDVTGEIWLESSRAVSVSQSSAADMYIKIGDIKGESVSQSSVVIDQCDIDNSLVVHGGGGVGSSTTLSTVRVADKSSPKLAEACVVLDSQVTVLSSSVGGSARLGSHAGGGGGGAGKVSMNDFSATGTLSIESSSSVSVSQASAADMYIKIDGIDGEAVSHSSVVLDQCVVENSLQIRGGGGDGSFTSLSSVRVGIDKSTPVLAEVCVVEDRNVTATDVSVHGSAHFSGGGGGGRVSIHDSSVSGTMAVDDWQHASVSSSSAGDIYIKIGDIKGEYGSISHSSVVLDSCVIDNSLEVHGGGGTGSFTSLSNVSVALDKSTPHLAETCVVHDQQISVSSSSVHGSARFSASGGGGAGKVSMNDFSVSGELSVSSSSGISLSQARAADMYLKIDGIKGESMRQSSVVLDRCVIDNTLVVHGGGGLASFTSLSSVQVGDSSSPVLSDVCVVQDRQVVVQDLSVGGSASFSSSSLSGRVSLSSLSVKGSLSVESSSSISVSQSSAASMYIKIDGIDGEAVSRSSVVLDRCDVDGALEVYGGGGTGSFTALSSVRFGDRSSELSDFCVVQDRNIFVRDMDGDGHADLATVGGGGLVVVSDSSVSGALSVSSSRDVSVSQTRAADMYIKIDGIDGEAVSSSSVTLDRCVVDNTLRVVGGGGSSSFTSLSSVSVAIDKATPKLADVCVVEDRHVSVSDSSVGGSVRLSSVGPGGSVVADGLSVARLLRASSSQSLSLHHCDASTGLLSVSEQPGQADTSSLSLESCVFDQSLFVLGGTSSTLLSNVHVGAGYDPSSSVFEDTCVVLGGSVSISNTEVVGGMRVSSGEGGLHIDGLSNSGALHLHSLNGSVVAQKVHASSATVLLDSSRSTDPTGLPSPPLQLHLVDSVFDGDLTVETSDAPDLIVLDHLHVGGVTWLEAGDGDDVLQVLDSVFDDLAIFDGGGGQDQVALEGNQFAVAPLLLNWEQVSQ